MVQGVPSEADSHSAGHEMPSFYGTSPWVSLVRFRYSQSVSVRFILIIFSRISIYPYCYFTFRISHRSSLWASCFLHVCYIFL